MRVVLVVCLVSVTLWAEGFTEALKAYENRSYTQALDRFLVLAKEGNGYAQYNVALLYANALGVKADREVAIKWYEKSARQGIGEAQFNLARLYDEMSDPTGDYAKRAKYWYEQAIHSGIEQAYNNLGVLYVEGRGVEKSEKKALILFEKGVSLGHRASQVNSAILYIWGSTTTHDKIKAKSLLESAIAKGEERAKGYLDQLCTQNRWVCEK
jgi:TPR repeat protein